MTQAAVLTNVDEYGVATLTLNRPQVHNAFDDKVIQLLTESLQRLSADKAVRVLILAASGKSFSAGADLHWMRRMAQYSYQENLRDAQALANLLKTLNDFPKPTIARVQGAAYGGAVGLVSCCDIAVAAAGASFCLSEVKIGLVPATISPYVIAAIGQRAARRYFTTAEPISAEEAERLGLVSRVVEEESLDSAVDALVAALLANGPKAVSAAKQLVLDMAGQPVSESLIQQTSELIASIRVSPEGQEGLTAFLEKRSPGYRIVR